jgi:four helix bundle protein
MKDFRQLKVWEQAHALVLAVYKVTAQFPRQETYGLTSQIQRAAVSIPANISEGCGKDSDAELKRFLLIAMGSASELEYLLLLAHDLAYLPDEPYQTICANLVSLRKMLNSFIQKLKAKS